MGRRAGGRIWKQDAARTQMGNLGASEAKEKLVRKVLAGSDIHGFSQCDNLVTVNLTVSNWCALAFESPFPLPGRPRMT